MALCWGKKATFWNKNLFPYPLAGQLSTQLWHQIFPELTVIFHIIICENSSDETFDDFTLEDYIAKLNQTGANVVITKINNCEECVLTSQVIRLLAYNAPEVRFCIGPTL